MTVTQRKSTTKGGTGVSKSDAPKKYYLKFIQELDVFKNGDIIEEVGDKTVKRGVYDKGYVPGGRMKYVPLEDSRTGRIFIDEDYVSLKEVVPLLNVRTNKGKKIKKAQANDPGSPFWAKVHIWLKLYGHEFSSDVMIDRFWLANFMASPVFWFVDEEPRPPTLTNVTFEVRTMGSGVLNYDDESDMNVRQHDFSRSLVQCSREIKILILRYLGEFVGTGEEYGNNVLEDMIVREIGTDYERVIFDNVKIMPFINRMIKAKPKSISVWDTISSAKSFGIIDDFSGDYMYGEIELGKTMEHVAENLGTPGFKKALMGITKDIQSQIEAMKNDED